MRAIAALSFSQTLYNSITVIYKLFLNLENICLCTITYPLILMIYTKSCYDLQAMKCDCRCIGYVEEVAYKVNSRECMYKDVFML
jgi:hypothetical protein